MDDIQIASMKEQRMYNSFRDSNLLGKQQIVWKMYSNC